MHNRYGSLILKPTLLIAESDPELCAVYERFIRARGYKVETACDGLECLAKLRRVTPAAIVLDLGLRWGGGDGVLAWLREEKATHGIAVILTATAPPAADLSTIIEPPVIGLLFKPFTLSILLEKVRYAVATAQEAARHRAELPPFSELYLG
jgi:DNA-binding response OmpR family regulator